MYKPLRHLNSFLFVVAMKVMHRKDGAFRRQNICPKLPHFGKKQSADLPVPARKKRPPTEAALWFHAAREAMANIDVL
jgi:hypothetical protein